MDLICQQCSRIETEPYDVGDLCSCGGEFAMVQSGPTSLLDKRGIRVAYHHDGRDEWVVRLHSKTGIVSLCGCPGEAEAKTVCACIAAAIATADVTFSIRSGGGEPEQVECNNLVEFDAMGEAVNNAATLLMEMTG
jgi:hypothetical protein